MLKNFPCQSIRQEIHNLPRDLVFSTSSQERLVFLELCDHMSQTMSRSYFKQTFVESLFLLGKDKSSNI